MVEAVGLRITTVRDARGVLWYIRNGEIIRVGNKSQGWARVVLDIGVSWDSDVDQVREVMKATADEMAAEEEWADKITEAPEVLGRRRPGVVRSGGPARGEDGSAGAVAGRP